MSVPNTAVTSIITGSCVVSLQDREARFSILFVSLITEQIFETVHDAVANEIVLVSG